MARGDYVEVTYRTGVGTEKKRISARSVGAKVDVEEPRSADLFLVVKEINKADEAVEIARFAKGEVVAVLQGHEGKS